MKTLQKYAELYKTLWKNVNESYWDTIMSAFVAMVLGLLFCNCAEGSFELVLAKIPEFVDEASPAILISAVHTNYFIDTVCLNDIIILVNTRNHVEPSEEILQISFPILHRFTNCRKYGVIVQYKAVRCNGLDPLQAIENWNMDRGGKKNV